MRTAIAGLALVAALLLSPCTATAQTTTLRFSSFEPPVAFITKEILTPWAQRVSEDSGGALKIDMFPGGTLGRDPAAQMKLVVDGIADIAWIVPGYTPGRFDATSVLELPFIVKSARTASLASTRMFQKGYWKGGGFDEVKLLCVCGNNPVLVNTTYPAKTLADLKNRKFRAAGPVSLEVIKALGAVPVGGITGPQLAENLSRGLVDGTLNEWNALQTFRALEVVKNHIVLPLGSTPLLVIMNKAKYESLPPAAKAAIDKHSGEAFAQIFGDMFDKNNRAVFEKASAERGRVITTPTDAEAKEWQAAVKPVYDSWKRDNKDGELLFKAFTDEVAAIEAGK
jgi:TRAP-type C4-dicarboxylate transport system substrate-binding protein